MTLPTELSTIFKVRNKSYKMVLVIAMLNSLDEDWPDGFASINDVARNFQHFYVQRESNGLIVDTPPNGCDRWLDVGESIIRRLLDTPIQALSSILEKVKEPHNGIRFKTEIWNEIYSTELEELREYAQNEIDSYFGILRPYLLQILNTYLSAKQEPLAKHPLGTLMRNTIPKELTKLSFIRDEYRIQGSIGRPNWVNYPWIALIDNRVEEVNPRHGFYVCYVFDKNMESVYLTLKHSDQPLREKGVDKNARVSALKRSIVAIREKVTLPSFEKDDLVDPYTTTDLSNYLIGVIAYKKYNKDSIPDEETLVLDLKEVITAYRDLIENNTMEEEESEEMPPLMIVQDENVVGTIDRLESYIKSKGFSYPKSLIKNFYVSLKSKPFAILAGISGTGKTKLVKLFAEALGATRQNKQFTLIPVRPDWSDPSDLLGYKNLQGEFCPGVLIEVLYEASKPENRSKPYFICLDEMNLARVEHYFSDLLSLMETQEWEPCDDGEDRIITSSVISDSMLGNGDDATGNSDSSKYRGLHIPENVYIIGTVNMDETTHPFSKKVLDRANTIEFNYIDLENIGGLDDEEEEHPEPLQVHQSFLRSDYLTLKDAIAHKDIIVDTTAKLTTINKVLEPIHAHVGFRIRDAVCFYMIYNKRFNLLSEEEAFDIQLCQKILPRIQGSSMSIRKTLIQLLEFTVRTDFTFENRKYDENDLHDTSTQLGKLFAGKIDIEAVYPESAKKIIYMLRRLEEDGFTSFWLS